MGQELSSDTEKAFVERRARSQNLLKSIVSSTTEEGKTNLSGSALRTDFFPSLSDSCGIVSIFDAQEYEKKITGSVWNRAAVAFPLLVISPQNDGDVVAAINGVLKMRRLQPEGKKKIQITAMGGGHSTHSMVDGAVVLDMNPGFCQADLQQQQEQQQQQQQNAAEAESSENNNADDKKSQPQKKTPLLVAGAGCRLEQVGTALLKGGSMFTLPIGTSFHNGLAGSTLCGGIGHHLQLGLTASFVEYIDMAVVDDASGEAKIIRAVKNQQQDHGCVIDLLGSGYLPGVALRFGYRLEAAQNPPPSSTDKAVPHDAVVHGSIVEIAPRVVAKESFISEEWLPMDKGLSRGVSSCLVLPGGAPVLPVMVIGDPRFMAKSSASGSNIAKHPELKNAQAVGGNAWMRKSKWEVQSFFNGVQRSLNDKQPAGHYLQTFIGVKDLAGNKKAVSIIVDFSQGDNAGAGSVFIIFRNRVPAQAQAPPAFAFHESDYILLVFAKVDTADATSERNVKRWFGRLYQALKECDALEPKYETMHLRPDGTEAAAEPPQGDCLAFSLGAPSSSVRAQVVQTADKYDPNEMFVRSDIFGYGGPGRIF